MIETWSDTAPDKPGIYYWRRSWQWVPIEREITPDGRTFSHRYEQFVPVAKVGGQWGEEVK